jgi:hypothetical protein
MNTANILASVIFGSIGFAAFIYGKKQTNFKTLAIGVILMVYPYFVQNPILLYAIGAVLTVLLFVF